MSNAHSSAATDLSFGDLCLGDKRGTLYVWKVDGTGEAVQAKSKLAAPHCRTPVRRAAFSPDGRFVAICGVGCR